tara:strand:+ start:71 stop:199 length:129 start_codon:yes stop_codon:yes gene_type:complete
VFNPQVLALKLTIGAIILMPDEDEQAHHLITSALQDLHTLAL